MKHITEHEYDDVEVWVWVDGNMVCFANLLDVDLEILDQLVVAIEEYRTGRSRTSRVT